MQSYAYLHDRADMIVYHLADYFEDRRLVSPHKHADACTYVLKWKDDPAVWLPSGLTEIQPYAFQNSGFPAVICPDDLQSIGEYAFKDSKQLTAIYIGSDTEIDPTAFDGCTALVEIQSDRMGGTAQELADQLGIAFSVRMF